MLFALRRYLDLKLLLALLGGLQMAKAQLDTETHIPGATGTVMPRRIGIVTTSPRPLSPARSDTGNGHGVSLDLMLWS